MMLQHRILRSVAAVATSAGVVRSTINQTQRRTFAVYAVGHGWPGAMGIDMLEEVVPGHEDDDDGDYDGGEDSDIREPHLLYDGEDDVVLDAAAGWSHSAIIVGDKSKSNSRNKLLVVGRPHDFQILLRLRRLPQFMRQHMVRATMKLEVEDEASKTPLPPYHPSRLLSEALTYMIGDESSSSNRTSGSPSGDHESERDKKDPWEDARTASVIPRWTEIPLPSTAVSPIQVVASAGLTSILGDNGLVYNFGLNQFGQCGVGSATNNVWMPTQMSQDNDDFDFGRDVTYQQVGLGLQHGVALTSQGRAVAWGKGERGQLGAEVNDRYSTAPQLIQRVTKALPTVDGVDGSSSSLFDNKVRFSKIAAGLNRCAAIDAMNNHAYQWGKNVAPPTEEGMILSDALLPIRIAGLPEDKLQILDISCGSAHTAILMEDGSVYATGVPTDTTHGAVLKAKLICDGTQVAMPVRHFEAHWDRTTVVDANGNVLAAHLWSTQELQDDFGTSTPSWFDHLADKQIQSVHRGWLHTLIVTQDT